MKRLIMVLFLLFAIPAFGTVSEDETVRQYFSCNGSVTAFTFTFACNSADDVLVYTHIIATGVESLLTVDTDYTIEATSSDYLNGGVVTTTDTYASTYRIVIVRSIKKSQETISGATTVVTVEASLDKLTRQVQDLEDRLNRTVRLQETDSASFDMELPGLALRAETYPYFGDDGTLTYVSGVTPDDVEVSSFMETVLDDTTSGAAKQTLGLTYYVDAYGAIPDDGLDDSEYIQAAIDAAEATGGGKVNLSAGVYTLIADVLTIEAHEVELVGENMNLTIIDDNTGSGNPTITINSTGEGNNCYNAVRDLAILGNATSGIGINANSGWHHLIKRVKITDCGSYGLQVYGNVYYSRVADVHVRDCDDHGIYLVTDGTYQPNINTFINVNSWSQDGSDKDGMRIANGNGNVIIGGSFQGNTGYGLYLGVAIDTVLTGSWFEGNTSGGYYIARESLGCDIQPGRSTQTYYNYSPSRTLVSPHTPGGNPEGIISTSWTSGLVGDLLAGGQHSMTILPPDMTVSPAVRVADTRGLYGRRATITTNGNYAMISGIKSPAMLAPGNYRAYFYMKSESGTATVAMRVYNSNDGHLATQLTGQVISNSGDQFIPYPAGGMPFIIGDTDNYSDDGDTIEVKVTKSSGHDSEDVYISQIVILPEDIRHFLTPSNVVTYKGDVVTYKGDVVTYGY